MKNWLKVLVAMVLVLTFVFAFAACNKDSAEDDSGNKQDSAQKPGDDSDKGDADDNNGGNTDDGKDDGAKPDLPTPPDEDEPDIDDELTEGYKINFYYSYTGLVTNENDRTQEVNQRKLVKSITIPYDNEGWEQVVKVKEEGKDEKVDKTCLEIKDSIFYNGYKFEKWYSEENWDRKSKPQKAIGDPFTFTGQITEDINLYGFKGIIAGDDITWKIQYDYQTDAAIPPETLLEGENLVNFVIAQKAENIYSKTALAALVVNGTDGWTTELVAAKNALKFNNFGIVAWYTDWDFENNAPVGDAYAFDAVPAETVTLYGQLAEENDGTNDQTQKSKIAATLYLDGKGLMYDFNNRSSVDVPWYDYRKDITNVVFDDEITYIGQNTCAEMTSLKTLHFPEKLEGIGGYAFYKIKSSYFKTLRLPAKVKTVGTYAFAETSLTQVILNDGLETLKVGAFKASNKINSIVIPTSLVSIEQGAFHPGASGSSNNTHALSKIYFNGGENYLLRETGGVRIKLLDPETGEQKFVVNEKGIKELLYVTIGLDNEWFNELATVYSYMPKTGEDVALDTLSWYDNVVDGVKYPAQYSYAIKYKEKAVSLKAIFVDYVPIVAKIDETTGDPVFDEDNNLIYEGRITADNIANQKKLMHADGYGYIEFVHNGSKVVEGMEINNDIDIDCLRSKEVGSIISGELGGGITWKIDGRTLTISPAADDYVEDSQNPVKNKTNHMWDVANVNAAGMLWYKSMNKVSNIEKIVIEEGIEHIGSYVFAGTGITEISIPTSVTSIAPNAFENCKSLHSIYYEGENFDLFNYYQKDENGELVLDDETGDPILLGNYANEIKTSSAKVYAKATAPTAKLGRYWYAIGEQKVAWILDETGKLYVGGDSTMVNFATPADAPWYDVEAKNNIKSVTIAGNITSVAENLVLGYSNVGSIKLHEKIKYIPESAFVGTGLLNDIEAYPGGVLIIDKVLLKVDPTRRNTELFATNADTFVIADGAFSRCDNIKTVYISNTIQYINANAFEDTSLEKLYVDNTKGVWSSIAADCDFSNATNPVTQIPVQMFYKGDFLVDKTEYKEVTCNHVLGEVVVEDSTCSTTGIQKSVCLYGDNCASKILENQEVDGEMVAVWVPYFETSVIDKNPSKHNYVNPVYTAPTCLKDGYTTYTCDVEYVEIVDGVEVPKTCGHTKVEYVEGSQLTHTTVWEETDKVEDSCVAAGYTEYKCTGFDTVGGVKVECTATKKEDGKKLDHTFSEYVDNGDGTETATCTTCPEGTTPAKDTRQKQNVEE